MNDLNEIDRMTFRDFRLRLKAYELRRLDEEYQISLLAWQMREIGAKKKSGKYKYKYIYDSFRKFFDYEEQEEKIMGKNEHDDEQKDVIERYKEYLRTKRCQTTT